MEDNLVVNILLISLHISSQKNFVKFMIINDVLSFPCKLFRLRQVKLDQRKLNEETMRLVDLPKVTKIL